MSENWRQSEVCSVISDKSQGSIAKHLGCDGSMRGFIFEFIGHLLAVIFSLGPIYRILASYHKIIVSLSYYRLTIVTYSVLSYFL